VKYFANMVNRVFAVIVSMPNFARFIDYLVGLQQLFRSVCATDDDVTYGNQSSDEKSGDIGNRSDGEDL
jgi:hypothetical protein